MLGRRRLLAFVALGAASTLLGLMVASTGPLILIGLLGAGAALVFFNRPDIGMLTVVALLPLENAVLVAQGVSATRVVGMLAFLAWAANRLVWSRPWKPLLTSPLLFWGCAFVGFALASVLWAWVPRVAFKGAFELVQLFALALMVFDLVKTTEVSDRVVRVLVVGGTIAAIITIEQYLAGSRRAGGEVAGGINATATLLVTLLPFGFYLFRADRRLFWRALGFGYVVLGMGGVLVTFSRMNMMLLVPVVLTMCALTVRGKRGRIWVAALAIGTLAVGASLVPWDEVAARADTIVPYIQASLAGDESNTRSGRGYHLLVALAMARDHPVAGVGYLNYGYFFLRDYQFSVTGSSQLYMSPRSPHSSHAGILADLGTVGLSLWLILLFGVGLRSVLKAWFISRREEMARVRFFVEAVLVAFALHALPYGFYQPDQREKFFWFLLALTVSSLEIARGVRASEQAETAAGDRIEWQPSSISRVTAAAGPRSSPPSSALILRS